MIVKALIAGSMARQSREFGKPEINWFSPRDGFCYRNTTAQHNVFSFLSNEDGFLPDGFSPSRSRDKFLPRTGSVMRTGSSPHGFLSRRNGFGKAEGTGQVWTEQ